MALEDVFRIAATRLLAVGSSGGVAGSTTSLGAETYAVDIVSAGIVTSTGGVRFVINEIGAAAADSTSALLPFNWMARYKCTPGQRISAISNDAVIPSVTIIELTK